MMQPDDIIHAMAERDEFSRWLGIEFLEQGKGFCMLKMIVRKEMCNGFGIAHGGITYSFADSALAFASNSNGKHALSIETSISHIKPANVGDVLVANAVQKSLTKKLGIYEVVVTSDSGELIALFKGTVYVKDVLWQAS